MVLGGGRPDGLEGGFFVEPTLIVGVPNSARVAQEEIFGPVLVVIPHDGDDDAVALANDSAYGLSGSVWSADRERAVRRGQPDPHRHHRHQRRACGSAPTCPSAGIDSRASDASPAWPDSRSTSRPSRWPSRRDRHRGPHGTEDRRHGRHDE